MERGLVVMGTCVRIVRLFILEMGMMGMEINNLERSRKVKDYPKQNLGEVIDKLSILTRKIYFGMEDAVSEHRYLEKGLEAFGVSGKLITNVMRLTQMNFEIWNLENEIRSGGENKFSLEEIGRRAVLIRDLNRKRIDYKNKITELTGSEYKEVKVNHRSQ